jgi:hypothetical protein
MKVIFHADTSLRENCLVSRLSCFGVIYWGLDQVFVRLEDADKKFVGDHVMDLRLACPWYVGVAEESGGVRGYASHFFAAFPRTGKLTHSEASSIFYCENSQL